MKMRRAVIFCTVKWKNILYTIKRRKANWIGHILHRNCLLKHIIEGKILGGVEVMGRQGRRREQLLDGFKEMKGCRKLREEALYSTLWRTCLGRGYGPAVRQTWNGDESSHLIYCICA
jgi:hypothetical protein